MYVYIYILYVVVSEEVFFLHMVWSNMKIFQNRSIWLIDGALTSINTPGQNGLGSNGIEGVLHIPEVEPHHKILRTPTFFWRSTGATVTIFWAPLTRQGRHQILKNWFISSLKEPQISLDPVSWGCRIYRLQRAKTPSTSVLDMTLNNPIMLELWGMWSTPSLPSFPGPFWSGVVAPNRVLSESNRTLWHLNKWLMANWIAWNKTAKSFNCV